MPFTADLNPKKSGMDLLELMKMEDYLGRKTAKSAAKTATPTADAILAKPNNMVKSSSDDVGVEFRFNRNQE